MTVPDDLRSILDALTKALDAAGIPYAVCGALALAIHGHPRATKDIDLLTPADQVAPLKTLARGLGFTLEALPMTFSSSGITVHRINRISAGKLVTLDIIDASGVLEPVWNTREHVTTELGPLCVVSRQGLVTMKLAAGRPQDLADLVALEGSS